MLCPKYMHPLTAGGSANTWPAVISFGGELLASHICGGSFMPENDRNMYISHACYVTAPSFHLRSGDGPGMCHHAVLQRIVSPHTFAADSVKVACYYFWWRNNSPSANNFPPLK